VTFVTYDDRFEEVLGDSPRLVCIVHVPAHEGPVYSAAENALYFTTPPRRDSRGVPHVAIRRLQLDALRFPLALPQIKTVRHHANVANGMFLDRDGSLIVCEQGTFESLARISRVDPATGADETVVDSFRGFRFNSPNDVVVRSDGTIWFTDPSYGHLQGFRLAPELGDLVYRYDPHTDRVTAVADLFDKPNGVAFSPDEQTLYIADNGAPHHLLAFDVEHDVHLRGRRVVAAGTSGHPDGLKVDTQGRIYASAADGVQVFDQDGTLVGEICLPGAVNFTFGGPDRNVLFITADSAIWAAVLNAKGASPWPSSEPARFSTTTAPVPPPRLRQPSLVSAAAVLSSQS
jgi:gluconolactonase